MKVALGLLVQDFRQPDKPADRQNRPAENQLQQAHGQPSGCRVVTKSYGAMGPSSRTLTRSAQSRAILSTAFSSSACPAVFMSSAVLTASSSCVGWRTLLARQ